MRDPMRQPPTVRHPDTCFLFGLCLLAGISQLVSGAPPGSVSELVPDWIATAWSLLLIVGSVATLAGVLWRDPLTGRLLEVAGRVMFAPAALAYAIAVVAAAGVGGVLAALTFIGFSASSLWRIRQILRDVGGVLAVLRIMGKARDEADRQADHKARP